MQDEQEDIVPMSEGEAKPTSVRIPEQLMRRIDAAAAETGHSRTDTINHLLRWGVAEHERRRALKKGGKLGHG